MKKKNIVLLTFFTLFSGISLFADVINQTDTPIFRFTENQPFAFNVKAEIGKRDLVCDNVVSSMDKTRFTAGIAVDIMPFLGLSAEAGISQAELDLSNDKGSYGFSWGVGADVNIFEFIISDSPVIGKRQWLQFRANAKIESNQSNFPGIDFSWYEYKIIPSIVYNQNLKTAVNTKSSQPMAVALEIGLIFSEIDGEAKNIDDDTKIDFSEESNIGVLAGVAFLAKSDWIGRINGEFYGGDGGSAIFSVEYNF
jgi:hypothetical protein